MTVVDTVRRGPALLPLALLVGISPFATDMYLPALPGIAGDLHVPASAAQLSLTAFLVGLAAGQLVLGPVSDGIGRRPVLLAGTALFALSSAVCAVTPDAALLVAARLAEGLAGAAGVVAGRATVSDVLDRPAARRLFATLAAVTAIGPALAPLLGGALLLFTTWRMLFVVLAVIGAALFVAVLVRFPESYPVERRTGSSARATLGRIGQLLAIPRFTAYVVTGCLATAGFFTYIAASSFVLEDRLGVSQGVFTLIFAVDASCMIVTSTIVSRTIDRLRPETLLTAGLLVCAGFSVVLAVAALAGVATLPVVWVCLALVTGGWGLVIPGTTILSQEAGRRHAGTAAALQGGLGFGVGGLATPLSGLFGPTLVSMAVTMAALLGIAVVVRLVVARRFEGAGNPPRAQAPRARMEGS